MRYSKDFEEYELLDMAEGLKLEKFKDIVLIRPDPQIIWDEKTNTKLWNDAHARYIRSKEGGGYWEKLKKFKEVWKINYKGLVFNLKPMGFKHTGIFPEQAVNWDYMMNAIILRNKQKKKTSVLNLFAYTGGATLACLKAGASVCHVDSAQGMVNWAKENVVASDLKDAPVRFIVDDVMKFVKREIRRGNKYDAVIMDPPSYGRGKNGEVWNIETDLFELLKLTKELLTKDPAFVIVNTYTGGLSNTIISNVLRIAFNEKDFKNISSDEIGIKVKNQDVILPCGNTVIWNREESINKK